MIFIFYSINKFTAIFFIFLDNISETGISRTKQIINLLKVHRNELLYELEPTAIVSALSKSKAFQKRSLHFEYISALASCNTKLNDILSMVEVGSTDVVEGFVAALKDLGYRDIVDLIDPPDVHAKAGNYFFLSLTIAL